MPLDLLLLSLGGKIQMAKAQLELKLKSTFKSQKTLFATVLLLHLA